MRLACGTAGVDAKRKVSFSVCSSKVKRSLPSSSSGTSTEGTEPYCDTMEAMDAAIAEIEDEVKEAAIIEADEAMEAGEAMETAPEAAQTIAVQ